MSQDQTHPTNSRCRTWKNKKPKHLKDYHVDIRDSLDRSRPNPKSVTLRVHLLTHYIFNASKIYHIYHIFTIKDSRIPIIKIQTYQLPQIRNKVYTEYASKEQPNKLLTMFANTL